MLLSASAILGAGFLIPELILMFFRRSSRTGDAPADGGSLRLLWWVILLAVCAGVGLALAEVGPHLCSRESAGWLLGGSIALFAAGASLRWWAIGHLGRFFTVDVAVARNHRLIDDGPYRFIRHPSYTGALMQFGGLALTFNDLLALPVILVPFFVALVHRIHIEEAALLSQLGKPYALYSRRTGRLLPRLFSGARR
jgi:protein-S-isoprenylcysteine O-methyltransferase